MNPSDPHEAPATPVNESDTWIGGPPLRGAIHTLFSLRNPTLLPSGEKKGVHALSVPGIAVA
jgi:hypothetical protein